MARQRSEETMAVSRKRRRAKVDLPLPAGPQSTTRDGLGIVRRRATASASPAAARLPPRPRCGSAAAAREEYQPTGRRRARGGAPPPLSPRRSPAPRRVARPRAPPPPPLAPGGGRLLSHLAPQADAARRVDRVLLARPPRAQRHGGEPDRLRVDGGDEPAAPR